MATGSPCELFHASNKAGAIAALSSICPSRTRLVDCVLPGSDGGAILSGDVPEDAAVPTALRRALRDAGLDASAVAATATAAAAARAATTAGSAIVDDVDV